MVLNGLVEYGPFNRVDEAAQEEELEFVQEELLTHSYEDVSQREIYQCLVTFGRITDVADELLTFICEIPIYVVTLVLLILPARICVRISSILSSVPNYLGISRKYKWLSFPSHHRSG